VRPNRKPPLTVAQTLSWADSHRARTGEWPGAQSGHVLDNRNEKWVNVNQALRLGLSGRSPLGRAAPGPHRGWPNENRGPIIGTRGEVWQNVNQALREGGRGLPGGDTLAALLARRLGVRNLANVPPGTRPGE